MSASRQVVIGLGNLERGDDAIGRVVLERLRGLLPADIALIAASGETAALLGHLEGAAAAYLVDACRSGAAPGTLYRFDAAASARPRIMRSCSTHGLGLAEALELARALGTLPERCLVYAIEGASFELGAPLSEPVRAHLDGLVARLAAEIGRGDLT